MTKAQMSEIIKTPILERIYVTYHIDSDPDLSWLTQDYEECTLEDREKYKADDARILRNYENGLWEMIGIIAKGNISITYNGLTFTHEFHSSIWGIASNDTEGIERNQQEQIQEIKSEAINKGIPISKHLHVIIDEDFKN